MMYYAVGTPVGRLAQGTSCYLFRQQQLFSIGHDAFVTWIRFLHGLSPDAAYSSLQDTLSRETFDRYVAALLDAELLIAEPQLKDAVCLRQGYGVGVVSRDGMCSVFHGQQRFISYRAFLFWAYCDGTSPVEAIAAAIQAQSGVNYTLAHAYSAIHELLRQQLLLIVD